MEKYGPAHAPKKAPWPTRAIGSHSTAQRWRVLLPSHADHRLYRLASIAFARLACRTAQASYPHPPLTSPQKEVCGEWPVGNAAGPLIDLAGGKGGGNAGSSGDCRLSFSVGHGIPVSASSFRCGYGRPWAAGLKPPSTVRPCREAHRFLRCEGQSTLYWRKIAWGTKEKDAKQTMPTSSWKIRPGTSTPLTGTVDSPSCMFALHKFYAGNISSSDKHEAC